jgi:hypothetical protein
MYSTTPMPLNHNNSSSYIEHQNVALVIYELYDMNPVIKQFILFCLSTEVRENVQQMVLLKWIADGTSCILWAQTLTFLSYILIIQVLTKVEILGCIQKIFLPNSV